jgi:hypothetical protein
MVTVAIRALDLECLVKILDWGRSRSLYIFTDSEAESVHFYRLWGGVCTFLPTLRRSRYIFTDSEAESVFFYRLWGGVGTFLPTLRRSLYIFTDSEAESVHFYRLRLFTTTPTPPKTPSDSDSTALVTTAVLWRITFFWYNTQHHITEERNPQDNTTSVKRTF